MRSAICAGALAAALLASGPAAAAGPPAPTVLTLADSGRTVVLAPHDQLRIRLDACASCGFHWETRTAPDPRVLRREPTLRIGVCKPPCVGGNLVMIRRYTALARGRTRLRLVYLPPGSDTPAKTFRLRVRVAP